VVAVVAAMAVAVDAAAEVAAVVAVAVTPALEVAATSGLEVAAAAGSSLDAEVALGSEVAVGSEVAGAAAAGSCSVTTGTMTTDTMTTGTVEAAAYPGEHAARAKSHDLGWHVARSHPARHRNGAVNRRRSQCALRVDRPPSTGTGGSDPLWHCWRGCLLAWNAGSRSVEQGHVVAVEEL